MYKTNRVISFLFYVLFFLERELFFYLFTGSSRWADREYKISFYMTAVAGALSLLRLIKYENGKSEFKIEFYLKITYTAMLFYQKHRKR
jgi:hypothetical protein